MFRRLLSRATVFVLAFGVILNPANAANIVVPHQGRLLDASDAPITGVRNVTYSIYEVPAGGAPLWSEMHPGVSIQAGLFDAMLGTITPLPSDVFRAPGSGGGGGGGFVARYLEVSVDGVVLSPRLRFGTTPSAAVASGVSGDFESSPGQVSMGDTGSDYYATFGEKVAGGLHAAGSVLASGASKITNDCDDDDATQQIARNSSSGDVAAVVTMCDTAGTSLKMKVDGLMGPRMSTNLSIGKQSGRFSLGADGDQDDVPESEFRSIVTPGTCSVAIQTKGTGADKNRTIGSSSDDSLSINYLDIDDDGDGISEARAVSAVSTLAGGGGGGAAAASYARWYTDSDDDGIPESDISQIATPGTCSVAIKTKGTGADKNRVISSTCDDSTARQVIGIDDDGDGVPDNGFEQAASEVDFRYKIHHKRTSNGQSGATSGTISPDSVVTRSGVDIGGDGNPESEISQSVMPGTCSVAIKTKGTGADKNRTIGSSSDDSLSINYLDIDDDGDGISEARAVSAVSTLVGGGGGGAAAASYARWYTDSDDDGVPEGDISQIVTPGTCSVAIKTRGTGADKNRSIGSSTDDSSAVQVLELDDDGDGIVEGRGIISVKSASGTGAMSASSRLSCDPNEDGSPEGDISQIVTPTTCSVAIQTKGTGADKNRTIGSTVDDDGALHYLDMDDNNDGVVERSITATVTDDDTQFRLNEGSTEVSLKTHKGGVIKGAININNGGALRVELDGDGNGYLSNSLGVGTTATHHIDVVGGAYCDGTNWVNASDKNSKENFQSVDGQELLDKIADLSITEWNYKADKNARHIGPTAQDFKKTFGVGADDKSISTIDPSGIALAAIKELYAQVKERDKEHNLQLQRRDEQIAKMQAELRKLREELKKN